MTGYTKEQAVSDAARYAAGLEAACTPHVGDRYTGTYRYDYTLGRSYIKIVQGRVNPGREWRAESVHAFLDFKTGAILKASSWAAPAKGVRFANVDAALAKVAENPNSAFAGGYLYSGR